MNLFFKTILCLGVAGVIFSFKFNNQTTAFDQQQDRHLKAKAYDVPSVQTPATDSINAEVVNLQAALTMYKLSYFKWPENKDELKQLIKEGDSSLDLDDFTTLSWTASGDTLSVSYDIYTKKTGGLDATLQEGKFNLFVNEDTIQIGDFSYRNHESLIILPKDSIE